MSVVRWLTCVSVVIFVNSCGPTKPDYDAAYDRIKLGMAAAEVVGIIGEGKATTIDQLPNEPKDELRKLPSKTKFFRWGSGMPFLVVGYEDDKVVYLEVVGAKK